MQVTKTDAKLWLERDLVYCHLNSSINTFTVESYNSETIHIFPISSLNEADSCQVLFLANAQAE